MLVLLIFLLTFSGGVLSEQKTSRHSEPNCPQNEHYVRKDTTCPKTCGNRLLPGETVVDCNPFTGCVCDSGYLRPYDNGTGPCIPRNKCAPIPKKCGINEMPTSCQTVCPPQSCESMYLACDCEPGDCKPGCDCIDEYLRNENGDCVPVDDCYLPGGKSSENDDCMQLYVIFSSSSSAESNASASSSYSYSDETSSSHSGSSSSSTSSSSSSTSIHIGSRCGTKCKDENAVYKKCPNPCPLTCAQPKPRPCPKMYLEYGCECKPEFILTKIGGKCVSPDDCPDSNACDDPNASPQECASTCQPTCENPDTSEHICTLSCTLGGCVCNSGYILDKPGGTCIRKEDCPKNQNCSDPNASPQNCPSFCQPTCDQPDTSDLICPAACLPSGCVCNPGYILEQEDGTCIKIEDCPGNRQCSDPNASPSTEECTSPCQPTCDQPDTSDIICIMSCQIGACVCNPGYILDKVDGTCIKKENCPVTQKCSDPNASPEDCPSYCQPTCDQPDTSGIDCVDACLPSGCVCNSGYILDQAGGNCIKVEDCAGTQQCSDPNASLMPCPSYCQPTCGQPDTSEILCVDACLPSGCVCNPGYILENDGGKCIKVEDCPDNQQCSDPNASPQHCPSYCQPTCDQPDIRGILCIDACLPGGCVCNPGYILDTTGGTCIRREDCPGNQQCSDPNASPSTGECTSPCQPTCEQPDTSDIICILSCQIGACVCNPGYVLEKEGGMCIKIEDCPGNEKCKDPNASPELCPSACQPTCDQPDTRDIICVKACLPGGCVCNEGYILDKMKGTCIKPEECPGGSPQCCGNRTYVDCFVDCQNRYCPIDDNTGVVMCNRGYACSPGCACIDGYLMLSDTERRCILSSECPPVDCTRPNELWDSSPPNCNQERCEDMDSDCDDASIGPPRCVCKSGYYRNDSGICVPASECDNQGCDGDRNATRVICPNPHPPTCAEPNPNSGLSATELKYKCMSIGCECKPGFVLSGRGGKCIDPTDCPDNQSCNGDNNATIKECPNACPATCADPDTRNRPCPAICLGLGCECKSGFILSEDNGECIDPDDCPGGEPECGANKTYVYCYAGCPDSYCPADDNRDIIACDPPYPCLSGCDCEPGYLMISYENPQCVLSSDCPPVTCTRPNEVWDRSPCNCKLETCDDIDRECDDTSTGPPRCVCISGYYRNDSDICVPASECDNQGCDGDRNATSVICPNPYPPTCAEPRPNIGFGTTDLETDPVFTCMSIGCECKPGFIMSEMGGQCIDPSDCPENQSCNGDFNATIKQCPNPCPATCADPDTRNRPCPDICLGIGCDCKNGFILSEDNGECIDPDDCPGGEPECGANKTYVYCYAGCPDSYCPIDDNRDIIACDPPYPCLSGCDCEPGYLMISYENPQCVLSSDCPPVTCTRPNEVWDRSPCNCKLETCDDIDRECDDTSTGPPRCVCISGYYRNDSDICVPASECDNQGCDGDRNATSVICPNPYPPTCAEPRPNIGFGTTDLETDPVFTCMSIGCECKPGFIMSKMGGQCIDPSDCPENQSCNGDFNATIKQCPNPCPATCADPDTRNRPCPDICLGIGCDCKNGFILSEDNGECIDPDDCPGGEPECGANKTYVYCYASCPDSYCPIDDNRDIIACDPPYPCLSGCDCEPGYLMLSYENPQCVLSSDCPPVTCTRPNEVWDRSPCNCKLETCDDIDRECDDTSTGPPRCVCISGYYRNDSDICVPASECDNQGCDGDRNATSVICPNPYPPTCAEPRPNIGFGTTDLETDPEFTCMSIGCECKPGFIMSERGGQCIDPSDCPENQSCNGDFNATIKQCPNPCPATCADPDTRNRPCPDICLGIGCDCKNGFILSEDNGECIDPDDCPGGEPECGANKTYVYCYAGCPDSYCPIDDNRDIIACDPPYPCLSGCDCEPGYLMISYENPQCVLSSDCPPVTCTRPNEVWDRSPCNCNLETCDDIDRECDDTSTGPPRCVCISGYYRNGSDICVPASECGNQGCNGDRNATSVICPNPNPPTCAEPRPNIESGATDLETDPEFTCMSIGCECKPGFIMSKKGGQCIDPSDCPGGIPDCGENQTYIDCFVGCPPSYCPKSDSRAIIACTVAYPCPPGCACKPGYLMLSYEDSRCVLSSECPPVTCTRPNEVWDPSPLYCYLESCEDIDGECDDTFTGPPRCVCKNGYYRNESDICVPASECDRGCDGDPNAKYSTCPSHCPPTCEDSGKGKMCITSCAPPGCVCKHGYILSKQLGKCVKPEQCPPKGCKGDPNAEHSDCPSYCPRVCDSDDNQVCIAACAPPGCVCKPGYIISHVTGKCVKPKECPPRGCKGDPNAVHSDCPSYCPRTCNSDDDQVCIAACAPPGCVCIPGYVISDKTGKCIKEEECPPKECNGDPNAVHSDCPSYCPATCDDSDDDLVCIDACAPPGCVCKQGYIISHETGKCVKPEECPPKGCKGDLNAVYSECPTYCPLTCDQPDLSGMGCVAACAPPGCVCKQGYLQTKKGKCVKPDGCPGGSPNCGANKTYVPCKFGCPTNYCPTSDTRAIVACSPPYPCTGGCACNSGYLFQDDIDAKCIKSSDCPPVKCTRPNEIWDRSPSNCFLERCEDMYTKCDNIYPSPPRCVCKPGYYRNDKDICIPASKCPKPVCGENEVASDCKIVCPPQSCESIFTSYLCADGPCTPGCNCKDGYLRNSLDVCIPSDKCFSDSNPCDDPNASPQECASTCQPTCEDPDTSKRICTLSCRLGGCVCNPGYILDKPGGTCIRKEDCPKPPVKCGLNEKAVKCRTICPPQNCEISYTDYDCSKVQNICEPGCDCLPNHLRNGSGICILNDDCPYPSFPICGVNEIARDCRRICPPQTCASRLILVNCLQDIPCEPGCDCVPNYLRNAKGECIPADKCDTVPPTKCPIPKKCIRTCASPNPPNCPYTPAKTNRDGCECKEGYILSKVGGTCIRIEDCPIEKGCNGDLNARTKQCPLPCPSTCDSPNASPCKKMCEPIGCECQPGYIFCTKSGKCILPDNCPGGNPCGVNEEFRQCKYNCPQDYCPVDDSRDIAVCDPWPVCMSGCACKLNHRRLSEEDDRCVVASDCPPVNCTRPNEVWDGCPSDCFSGYCEDKEYQNVVCNTLLLNCQPKCVCKKEYFRNGSDICVPENECPPTCSVSDECLRTCDSPNPPNCPYEPSDTNIDGCNCMEGYILSEIGGECIRIEECPSDGSCNGDPNARPKRCPIPCPSTCKSPEAMPCRKRCDPIGCECKPGYILSKENGQCIKPNKCPGGNPCGPNANFVTCKNGCPTDYCPVDDSRAIPICEPIPEQYCLSGCKCKLNHKWFSREDKRCIVSSDCPPVNCTRLNEVWDCCPSPCLAERCEDIDNQPKTCQTLVHNCQPACVCEDNFFRNETDNCVSPCKC